MGGEGGPGSVGRSIKYHGVCQVLANHISGDKSTDLMAIDLYPL